MAQIIITKCDHCETTKKPGDRWFSLFLLDSLELPLQILICLYNEDIRAETTNVLQLCSTECIKLELNKIKL